MKKLIFLVLLISLSVFLGYSFSNEWDFTKKDSEVIFHKTPILRFALIADSHSENGLLEKALEQVKGEGINFVIGLGDWSTIGSVEELTAAKKVFDESSLKYYLTAGDHDLWDSRNKGLEATANFTEIFGNSSHSIYKEGIQFVILDNSDIYKGLSPESLVLSEKIANSELSTQNSKLTFVFAHKTPFHPQSSHIMGEDNIGVARQAEELLKILEEKEVDGFFSGDLHFFAQFNSPGGNVKMTTIGAVNSARNFQGPRFAIVTVFDDYSWEVEDVEIR